MSGDDSLGWDESIFEDEEVFDIGYLPEGFLHRETQLESIKYALRPAVRGSRPLNLMCQGPPGTGKTTAIHILFDEIHAQEGILPVHVNCHVNSTRYSVFSRLFEGVNTYEPPKSGMSMNELYSQVCEHLVNEEKVMVVALDDVNYLFYESEASDTLYDLLRAHEAHDGAKIGVIAISSDLELDIIESLDGRVQSVFRPEDIYFPKYDLPEIYEILGERAKRGFRDGVVEDSVLDRAAELTADRGDLRVGIDLLRRAGLNAEMRASSSVEVEDIEEAFETAKYVHLSQHISDLSDSERVLVEIMAEHGEKPAGDLYEIYKKRTEIGYTRYSEIINKLDQLDLIDASYTNLEDGGRTRSLSLQYDAEAVLERL